MCVWGERGGRDEDMSLYPVVYKVVEGGGNLAWNNHVFTDREP